MGITRVGPGTRMGALLRRYWYPIAFEQVFDQRPSQTVRLLGEDWTLYKAPSGRYGVIGEHCPHRRASLIYGVVHEDGIRFGYHGWKSADVIVDGSVEGILKPDPRIYRLAAGRLGASPGQPVPAAASPVRCPRKARLGSTASSPRPVSDVRRSFSHYASSRATAMAAAVSGHKAQFPDTGQ